MTVANAKSGTAMQKVLDNLKELPPSTGAKDIDLIFLRGIMESPIVRSLAKAHERLEDVKLEAVRNNNVELVSEILSDISGLAEHNDSAAELSKILKEPHFQSLIETHDQVAAKSFETLSSAANNTTMSNTSLMPVDTVRMISIQKKAGEPLVYLRPHFKYNPETDNLIPCKEAGLAFSKGEILHIVNREDPNWWQACSVVGGRTGLIPSQYLEEKRKAFVRRDMEGSGILCGTITGKRKKKKMMYLTAKNAEFDRHELQIYEEVARMPPFQRKTLILIGAQGVGRRSLKNRLIVLNPLLFGTTVPFTSRRPREEEKDGQSYCFVSRAEMEMDIKAGRYLEHGEYDGNMYGTKIDSILEVVNTGRTCILDVNPQALKVLRTAEFMPFVVFIAAPELDTLRAMHKAVVDAGITTKLLTETDLKKTVDESARIKRAYSHYFDLTIVNDNLDKAFEKLQEAVEHLCTEPQWVPVNWVY
ncbi:MAGUK p55 subfamily member 6a isoform X3 [Hemibagrus wyckioides]|uniref:MAGUK p55 subfamily member 6a isoform X3 n=1 Tax=Hemibagrus wyckioides TaxID=337641 RepID=UPI00266D2D35|nr:MAGUK p55 subfamily member 6a isoform X3 [Hemibagrus wyckioides]